MINKKLLEIIDHLSAEEKHRLLLFVRSPYHNNGHQATQLIALAEYILESLKKEDIQSLEKEVVSQFFFPQHTFAENKKNPVDALASSLFQLLKEYLYIEGNDRDRKAGQLLSLVKFYRRNSFEDRFQQTTKQLRKHLNSKQKRGAWYYLDYFLMEEEISAFETTFNTYTNDGNLVLAHKYLDQFYTIIKLEFSAVLKFQTQLGQVDTKNALLLTQSIIENSSTYNAFQTPLAALYRKIIYLVETNNDDGINTFLSEINTLKNKIPEVKFRNLMAFYRYFVGRQFHQKPNKTEFLKTMYALYKEHLENGYFDVDEKILPQSLKSAISIAIMLNETSWAKKALQQYPPERITGTRFPQEAHDLCMAEVFFAEKNYKAAYGKLDYKKFENVNYSILADVLLVKIYYMNEDALLESRVHALEQKVRRSKLNKNNQRQYLNFINVIKRIIKYNFDTDSKQWQKIQKDVMEMTPLLERSWLKSIVGN